MINKKLFTLIPNVLFNFIIDFITNYSSLFDIILFSNLYNFCQSCEFKLSLFIVNLIKFSIFSRL